MTKLQSAIDQLNEEEKVFFLQYARQKLSFQGHRTELYEPLLNYLEHERIDAVSLAKCADACFMDGNKRLKLSRWMTKLYKIWEHFIAFELTTPSPLSRAQGKTSWLQKKGNSPKALEEILGREIMGSPNDLDNIYSKILTLTKQHEFLSQNQRRKDIRIQAVLDNIHLLDVGLKIKWACLAQAHMNVSGIQYNLDFVQEISRQIESDSLDYPPIITLYNQAYKILIKGSVPSHFHTLKQNFFRLSSLPHEDQKNLIIFAINYCIDRANKGDKTFINEAFSLYQTGIKKKTLLTGGNISKYTYANIVNHAIALKQWNWIDNFIEEFRDSLSIDDRVNTYKFNKARIHFSKGEFDHVKSTLSTVDFEDLNYNVEARRMMTKIFLTQKELHTLHYHLESFKIFLLRHKSQLRYFREYSALVKAARKSLKLAIMTKQEKEKLISSIKKQKPFADQQWLIKFLMEA